MMAIVDSNGDFVKQPEITEEEKKHIAEMLNEKHGNLSIESTIGFFEFIDMWKENLGILLKQVPEAEFVRVVRCKDCKHYEQYATGCAEMVCGLDDLFCNPDDYCSYGERKNKTTLPEATRQTVLNSFMKGSEV